MFPRGPVSYILLVITLLCLSARATAQVTCTPVFINEYKGSDGGPLQPHAVKALMDGTTLVAGRVARNGAPTYDGFFSRYAIDGTLFWSYFIGGAGNDDLTGITALNDGSFLFYGTTSSFGHPEGKGWLVHIDPLGAVLWSGQLGAATTSTDRIKAITTSPDGDIIGTLNTNDSSAASDPVVFKMGLDGTIRWTHRFDNGNDDSFTTLALSGDTVYAGGYYSSGGTTLAVLTEMRAGTGAHLGSRNINNGDATLSEQVTSLEIYNNTISYGLYVTKGSSYSATNGIVLVQTDLAGNKKSAAYARDPQGLSPLKAKRTPDRGFLVLRTNTAGTGYPALFKVNAYGYLDWGYDLSGFNAFFPATDITREGGSVTAGHYTVFNGGLEEVMNLTRATAKGEIGGCNISGGRLYTGPSDYQESAFTWAAEPAFPPLSNLLSPTVALDPLTILNTACASSVCVDHTPIPAGCGKTYNIQYTSARSSVLRDVIATPDGGRVAVGNLMNTVDVDAFATFDGLVTKYQSNGDIAWTKSCNIPGHEMLFRRILRAADGNLLALGNDYHTEGFYGLAGMAMVKLDNNGNILWAHYYSDGYTDVADAASTPDNGFVVALNDNYGSGAGDYSYVARFDANANPLWRTEVTQPGYTPVFKAITCTPDAVFVAYNSTLFAPEEFGVDRLDLATGSMVYSRRHSAGSGTTVRMNGLFAIHDSVYAFLYHYGSGGTATVTNLLFGLDQQGNTFRALNLGSDPIKPSPDYYYGYLDAEPPSVTMTADQDFWLASRTTVSGANYMTITRLKPDGTVELSKLHSAINNYQLFNARPQGKGLIVVGAAPAQHTGNTYFTNAFVLKLDSSGQLQTGAAANCVATDRAFPVTPCTTCGDVFEQPKSAATPPMGTITTASPYDQDNDVTAVLYCFQPGNCNAVGLQQRGRVCALHDTLVYYLDHSGNCGAAATWTFDPSFFRPGIISGDSIELITQKAGSTPVSAQIEGYCSFTQQNTTANIVFTDGPFSLGPDTVICLNGPLILHAAPGYASYLWDDNSTAASLPVTAPGQYSVVATDQCGFPHPASIKVTDANAAFHLTADTIRCNTDVDTLVASSGYSNYQWSPAYNLQAQDNKALVTPGVTTRYTVSAWRSPACMVTKSVLVTALVSPAIHLGNDTSLCIGDSLLLDATPGFNGYRWSTGAATEKIVVRNPGNYWINATYSNGCSSRDTFHLVSLYDPKSTLSKDPVLCTGQDRILDAGSGEAAYLWSDGSTGSTLRVFTTGEYWVRITDAQGCVAADTVKIVRQPCIVGVFVPNAFTPDGNGHNDHFRPLIYGNTRLLDFAVFGRWGEKLFETQTPLAGWDGRINGAPAPAGTYTWFCRYQPAGEPEKMEKGTVILVR